MAHHHHHSHGHGMERGARLKIALALTLVYLFAEAVAGWLTNSLTLIADAGHMLTDVAALSLTLLSMWFGARPANAKKTFGYYRLEILAAFVNGVALTVLSLVVIYEAAVRWSSPPAINGAGMTAVAAGGLVINLIAAWLLRSDHHDLNMHGAWLHVMGDLLGSVAAIAAGLLIVGFGWFWADPVTSVLISVIIVFGAWRLIMESVNVLLVSTPAHIDLAAVERVIRETDGVEGVHDLHVWSIGPGRDALTAHIKHADSVPHSELLVAVRRRLDDQFGIEHLTIQMETLNNEAEAVYVCETGTRCFEPARQH